MKYIDAERLKCELEKRLKNVRDYMNGAGMKYKGPKYYKAQGKESAYDALLSVIDSLQQEQQEKKEVKFVFPKFLYARTTNNKTIDVSYAPQSLDAIEYIRSDFLEQEQPEAFDTVAFQKGVEEGKRLLMEGAVEGEVQEVYRDEDGIHCCVSVGTDYKPGTIVYVITIPKEKGQ